VKSFPEGDPPATDPGTQVVVDSFHASMARLRSLCWMPDNVWLEARRYERLRSIAFFEVLGRPYELRGDDGDETAKAFDLADNWNVQSATVPPQHNPCIGSSVAAFVDHTPEDTFGDACRAILESVVIGAFAAFEAFTGDLWEAMVNLRPRAAVTEYLKVQGKGQEKSVRIGAILEYDSKSEMGTLLRTEEKVELASLGATQFCLCESIRSKCWRPV
jgi:hypothetical protein